MEGNLLQDEDNDWKVQARSCHYIIHMAHPRLTTTFTYENDEQYCARQQKMDAQVSFAVIIIYKVDLRSCFGIYCIKKAYLCNRAKLPRKYRDKDDQ
jgi:hypothetical protein